MIDKVLYFFLSLLFFPQPCLSQSWVIEHIGTQEGLLSPDVWSLFQDQNNLLWIGTVAGVSLYDGQTFTNITHASDGSRIGKVKGMDQDRFGHLWIGSDQGLFKWSHGRFHNIAPSLNINVVRRNRGIIWLGCENGLFYFFENKTIHGSFDSIAIFQLEDSSNQLYNDKRITAIENKTNGNLLISTYYALYDLKDFELSLIWGRPDIKPDIVSIAVLSDEHFFWACDESFYFEFLNGQINALSSLQVVPTDVLPFREGVYLLAGSLYHYQDGRIHEMISGEHLPDWQRQAIVDRENNIWLATFEGLVKIKESAFTLFNDHAARTEREIYSISETRSGDLMFGGNQGQLWKKEGANLTAFFPGKQKIVPNAEIFDIYEEDSGAIWFGSGYQGIARYHANELINYRVEDGLSDNSRYFFYEDHQDVLWCGGDGGVTKIIWDKDPSIKFHNYEFPLPNKNTYASFLCAIESPDRSLWFGGTHGLAKMEKDQLLPQFIHGAPFSALHITDMILSSDSKLWISSIGEGLVIGEFSNDSLFFVDQISLVNNLPSNAFLSIIEDQRGQIWAGSYQGLCRIMTIDGKRKIRFFDRSDGFLVNNFHALKLLEDGNGKIWGGSSSGIFSLDPSQLTTNITPPKPRFTAIELMEGQVSWDRFTDSLTALTGLPDEMTLPHDLNTLSISFSATSMTKPSDLVFRHKLVGLSDSWVSSPNNTITYRRLPPGKYDFLIEAKNEDGIWSERPAQFKFKINPAWWQRTTVRISFILIGLFLMHQSLLTFRRRNERREQEKTLDYFAHSNYASNSVEDILWDLTRNVVSRLNVKDCAVYILDKNDQMLTQVAAIGVKNPHGRTITNPIKLALGEGIIGIAAASKQPILVSNINKDPSYDIDLDHKGSELAVPILHEGEVLGVIDSAHSKKGYFKGAHIKVFQKIAEHCSRKIATARAAQVLAGKERQILNIKKEIAESKLTALQAQMNPHFIFNSLNSINWYVVKNRTSEASQYLTKFSKLVRLILDNSRSLTISLAQELETLRLYLDLESMRFEDRFSYQIQTDSKVELEEVQIPPLILQPFIENAIWHGIMPKKERGNLLIQLYPESGHLKCIVQDNGIGRRAAALLQHKSNSNHTSKGLKLTSDRIQLMHQNYFKTDTVRVIDLVDEKGNAVGTRVEVLLPYDD